jgi:hypothetical protein
MSSNPENNIIHRVQIISNGVAIIGIICADKASPFSLNKLYLDFDVSLLELTYLSHFSLVRFLADYVHTNNSQHVFSVVEDANNTGPRAKAFAQMLRSKLQWTSLSHGKLD